jgi:hypothetical protein
MSEHWCFYWKIDMHFMKDIGRTTAIVNTDAHDILRPSYVKKWVIPEAHITDFNITTFEKVNI